VTTASHEVTFQHLSVPAEPAAAAAVAAQQHLATAHQQQHVLAPGSYPSYRADRANVNNNNNNSQLGWAEKSAYFGGAVGDNGASNNMNMSGGVGGGNQYASNPVGALQERFQSRGIMPEYRMVQAEGASHCPTFSYQVFLMDYVATGKWATGSR